MVKAPFKKRLRLRIYVTLHCPMEVSEAMVVKYCVPGVLAGSNFLSKIK